MSSLQVQETFKLIDEKNTLLNSLMGEGVEGLDGVMSGWIKFEGKLNGQREKMKDEVGGEVEDENIHE